MVDHWWINPRTCYNALNLPAECEEPFCTLFKKPIYMDCSPPELPCFIKKNNNQENKKVIGSMTREVFCTLAVRWLLFQGCNKNFE